MDNQQFFKSFLFLKITMNKPTGTDHFKDGGAPTNYIGVLLHGSARFKMAGSDIYLKENEIIFIPKGETYHSFWTPDKNGDLQWVSLGFDFLPTGKESSFSLQKIECSKKALVILEKLISNPEVTCENIGYLYQFLGLTLENMEQNTSPYNLICEKALEFMRQNTDAKIPEVANVCKVSESGLYGIFKIVYNETPNYCRQKILFEKAEQLLITTNLPIEEISQMLNFSSASYFRKIVKKHSGKTPKQIRKTAQLQ